MMILMNPPHPPGTISEKDVMGGFGQLLSLGTKHKWPPLDLLYTAAVLTKEGISFKVVECSGLGWEISQLLIYLQEEKPEYVAIRTSTSTFEWDMRVAYLIKQLNNAKIIVFGPHATILPEDTLALPFIDAVVIGEPEMTLLDIARQDNFIGLEGLWYKQNGAIIKNNPRELILDLDKLPFPAWNLVPYQAYVGVESLEHLKPFVTSLTNRGCPHGCLYCPIPVAQGRKIRVRSVENVLDELEWLTKELGVKAVHFRDPEFAFFRERVLGICQGILKRKIHLFWRCETRIADLDEEVIILMAKAGCRGIHFGVETIDEEVLQNVSRPSFPLKQTKKTVNICQKNRIEVYFNFIIGLPAESKKSSLKTIDYALKIKPNTVSFLAATPYPGTKLRAWAKEKGYIVNDSFSSMTGYKATMRNEYLTIDEIQWLLWFAYESWEMSWDKIFKRIFWHLRGIFSELKRWLYFQKEKYFNNKTVA